MATLSQEDMKNEFTKHLSIVKNYQKFAVVQARKAIIDEHIITVIDGIIETGNKVIEPSVIIKGLYDEEYILSLPLFEKRYQILTLLADDYTTYQSYQAIGTCMAYQYQGDSLYFMAPWGNTMIVENGDYLATNKDTIGIYRIEEVIFKKSYKLI